jgi:hypothetical protein
MGAERQMRQNRLGDRFWWGGTAARIRDEVGERSYSPEFLVKK